MKNKRKNITVSEATHLKFKIKAIDHGMKMDAYLLKIMRQSESYEIIKGL